MCFQIDHKVPRCPLHAICFAKAVWRCEDVKLGQRVFPGRTFGVLGETQSFGGNAGGPNFGLIKFATAEDTEIRPTFLSQTPYEALVFDFTNMSNPLLELTDGLPQQSERQNTSEAFLTDLRPYGTGVQYYAVAVEKLFVDGVDILDARKPTVAILDTGTTGLVLPKSLFSSFDAVRTSQCSKCRHQTCRQCGSSTDAGSRQ